MSLFLASWSPLAAATRTWTGSVGTQWTTAGNWSGSAAPAANDDLVFPQTGANQANTNDYPPGTSFHSITVTGDGYSISGNAVGLGGGGISVSSSNGPSFKLPITLTASQTWTLSNIVDVRGPTNLNGKALTVAQSIIDFRGPISGAGSITSVGTASVILDAANTTTAPLTVNDMSDLEIGFRGTGATYPGSITLNATPSVGAISFLTTNTPTIGSLTLNAGYYRMEPVPGNAISVRNLILSSAATWAPWLTSTSNSSLINVSGTVALHGALDLRTQTTILPIGSTFTIINNEGSLPISGTFKALPEGAEVVSRPFPNSAQPQLFRISYAGGSGNDVVLTALGAAPQLQASFTYLAAPTQTVALTDASSGAPTSWAWNFGDGAVSSIRNPTHTYVSAGSYSVQLTVTNATGSKSVTNLVMIVPSQNACAATVTFLSQADHRWSLLPYDHTAKLIQEKGCALTCVAMVVNSAGLSPATDPGSLNALMNLAGGYDNAGNVQWSASAASIVDQLGRKGGYIAVDRSSLDNVLCQGHPVIVAVPHAKGELEIGHFVVVTGKTGSDYVIADPGHADRTLLLDSYGWFDTRGYVSFGSSAKLISRVASQSMPTGVDIAVSDSADLVVRDPFGRSTGRDQVTGGVLNEIPGAAYYEDRIVDETGDATTPLTKTVHLGSPDAGAYSTTVISKSSGTHSFNVYTVTGQGSVLDTTVQDVSAAGASSEYTLSVTASKPDISHADISIAVLTAEVEAAITAALIRDESLVNDLRNSLTVADHAASDRSRVEYLLAFESYLGKNSSAVDMDTLAALLRDTDALIVKFGGRDKRRAVTHQADPP